MAKVEFNEAVFKQIVDQIAEGRTLAGIFRQEGMPSTGVFYRWLREDPERRQRYETAQEEHAELMVSEMLDLVDHLDDGNSVAVQAVRLKTDVRRWMASKYARRFGDKQTVDLTANVKTDHESILDAARRRLEQSRAG